ncbi:hypothetical protein H6P81_009715 [Aristolochia fimbriata]|uniref:Uncharacterized protein n=1 Tax=Aristolochia fimbriata TaxID=158543 RepID=A0AAV7ELS3_ARIFI|nr:hypothetical protein H6P81_009715 [Aristolochia fimbriata]
MSERNVVSWTVMIACYARRTASPFEATGTVPRDDNISQTALSPMQVTSLGRGKATHAYVLEGAYFNIVSSKCTCFYVFKRWKFGARLWDSWICHVGLIEEGKRLFHDMVQIYNVYPSPNIMLDTWQRRSCRKRATKPSFELEPYNAGNYLLLADIYARS